MFELYKTTKEDLDAVAESISYVWKPELDFIFRDKALVKNVSVVTYDSQHLYLWTTKSVEYEEIPYDILDYQAYKIPHSVTLDDSFYSGWRGSLRQPLKGLIPREIYENVISGTPLTPFIKTHQQRREDGSRPLDAYYTKKSYLATIVHEFAHRYYNQHHNYYFGDKKQNIAYLETALNLYQDKANATDLSDLTVTLPSTQLASEVFAFCSDYTVAGIFWPQHKQDIGQENIEWLTKGLEGEKAKDLANEDSFLENQHAAAAVLGKIILAKYPTDWPEKLLAMKVEL